MCNCGILAAIKIYEERTGLVHVNIAMMNIGHCHCTAPNTSEQCACSEEGRNKVQTLFEAAVAAFCLLTWGKDSIKRPPERCPSYQSRHEDTRCTRLCDGGKQSWVRMPGPRQELADVLWSCCLQPARQSLHLLAGTRGSREDARITVTMPRDCKKIWSEDQFKAYNEEKLRRSYPYNFYLL